MIDQKIVGFMRELIQMEVAADVWDTGNPVLQVVALNGDEVLREIIKLPDTIIQESFQGTLAALYAAIAITDSLPANVLNNLKDTQVAGLMVSSEAWGIRRAAQNITPEEAEQYIAKVNEEIEHYGGLRNHPDAVDHKTITFTDGSSHVLLSYTRGREEVDELTDGEVETPTAIALDALARQIKWALS